MPCASSTVASAKMLRMSSSTISTFLPASDARRRRARASHRAALVLATSRPCRGAGRTRWRRAAAPASRRVAQRDAPWPRSQRGRRGAPAGAVEHDRQLARRRARLQSISMHVRAAEAGHAAVGHQAVDVAVAPARARGRVGVSAITTLDVAAGERGEVAVAQRRAAHRHQQRAGVRAATKRYSWRQRRVDLVDRLQRLGQEADRAGVQRALARVVGRDHADRDVARRQVGLQPLEDAPALHVGQEDVERDRAPGWYSRVSASAPAPLVLTRPLKPLRARRLQQHAGEARGRSRRSAAPCRPAGCRRGRRRRR